MKTRVISATVLIILVVACFALGPVTRALFLLAAMIMAVWETCRAIGYKNVVCQPWILYAYCVATVAELWFNADALAFEITFFLAVFAAIEKDPWCRCACDAGRSCVSDSTVRYRLQACAYGKQRMDPRVCDSMHIHLGVRQLCAFRRQKIRQAQALARGKPQQDR